jgi:ribosome-associated protein
MEDFILRGEYIKLCQLLKAVNFIDNGSDAKFEIQNGNVKVNGVVATERGKKIHAGDSVEYKGKTVHVREIPGN